ncbi:MAG: 3-deoxy-D-manno-octulosonic acid transferase [Maricaulis sp.]|nr:3-deoxy-D-manno-octulosonic acid transferase [Maricaulis sp.]
MSLPPALSWYRGLTRLAAPVTPALLKNRAGKGKEDPERRHERLGRPDKPRPDGQLIWLHGASVGESLVLASLVDTLAARHADWHFMVTTGTVTSARMLAERLPDRAFHQFIPVDTPGSVRRFLDHWRPDLAVFAESELWPNLIVETSRRGTPLALINARMNERSIRSWRRRPDTARWLLGQFAWIGAADTRTRDGLEDLTGYHITLAGNLKLEARLAAPDPARLETFRQALDGRPVWLAASTHPGEDEIVLDAHQRLLEQSPGALLILAPRHPERADKIRRQIEGRGLSVLQRSEGSAPPASGIQVWLTDTLGEMGFWFALAPASLIAGSLIPGIGGHNPVEASQAGSSVISGPFRSSFDDLYTAYQTHSAVLEVEDGSGLSTAVMQIWSGQGPTPSASQAALAAASGGAMAKTVTALETLLHSAEATS